MADISRDELNVTFSLYKIPITEKKWPQQKTSLQSE